MIRRVLILLVLGAALAVPSTAPAASSSLALGFSGVFHMDRAQAVGASWVRLDAGWPARARPAHPRDPADPAYDFTSADAQMRDADAHGMRMLLGFTGAPAWAEGPNRPRSAPAGSWRPNPGALADYAAALAKRYSGRYPDPLNPGRNLPRAGAFQVWNEPNLTVYLTPQWRKIGGHYRAVSPAWYRRMLNASYLSIKRVDPKARVAAAGTAPYGDLAPNLPSRAGQRIQPARFVRELLSRTVRFDIFDHHPYAIRGPFSHALNRDDVSIPDLGKLTRPLRAAERAGRVLPRGGHRPLWITEVSWDSNPPDPQGVPVRRQARWMAEAFYLLWKQGASVITWFHDTDEAMDQGYYQSGVFYVDGRPKPSADVFRFPFAAFSRGSGRALVWARAPVAGQLVIERRAGSTWRRVLAVHVRRGHVVQRIARVRSTSGLRARVGSLVSPIT